MKQAPQGCCYLCDRPLALAPSREHIIPESLGSSVWSRELLCEPCNNGLGHDIDHVIVHNSILPTHAEAVTGPGKGLKSTPWVPLKRIDGVEYRMARGGGGDITRPKLIEDEGSETTFEYPRSWTREQQIGWARKWHREHKGLGSIEVVEEFERQKKIQHC